LEEIVICANSYLQYKSALYIATHNYQKRPITILIPGNPDLFKFFNLINEKSFHNALKLIYFEPFHPDPRRARASGLNKVVYVLSDIIRERRYLKEAFQKYLCGIEGCELYFLDRGPMQFSLAKKLSNRNRLVYISPYDTQVAPRQYAPTNINYLARLIIFKLTYGCGIALGKLPHRAEVFPHMSARFLEKEFRRVIDGEERDEMMKGFELSQFKVLDVSRYRVIYFFDDASDYSGSEDAFRKELACIFDTLRKYFPESAIAYKYHPGYRREGALTEIGDVLPDFIPAELLYDDNVKMYFGTCSAAMSNVEKGLVVSILDLISFKNSEIRERLKEILINMSRSEVLFPKSLDELEEILISLRSDERK